MKKRVALLFISLFVTLLAYAQRNEPNTPDSKGVDKSEIFTYKIFPSANNTWGYDIYRNKKLTIHQPIVPSVERNGGFKTSHDVQRVAELVIDKLKKGEMPPTITLEEMKKLNVL